MLNYSVNIDVSKHQLWEAITSAEQRAKWWAPGILMDVRPGGQYREQWHDGGDVRFTEGIIEDCYPSELLGFTWRENHWPEGAMSKVSFAIESEGLKSRLGLRHEPYQGFTEAQWADVRADFLAGWPELLFSLRNFLHRCDAQSSHDLVIRSRVPVAESEALSFLREHAFFANSEILLQESNTRLVLAWKGSDVHPILAVRGNTLAVVNVKKEELETSRIHVVHTGFGFSREWLAAREWQDMAWTKFFAEVDED